MRMLKIAFKLYGDKRTYTILAIIIITVLTAVFAVPPLVRTVQNRSQNAAAPFLEDLDYLLHVLENNFDLFDVAYWAHGVDIAAAVEGMRETVRANPDMCVDEFYNLMARSLGNIIGGHFSFIGPVGYRNIVNDPNAWQHWFFPETSIARLSYPHVVAQYEHWQTEPMSFEQNFFRSIELSSECVFRRRVYRMNLAGEHELASAFEEAMAEGDFSRAANIQQQADGIIAAIPNVRTASLEEGRIAYLSYDSFWFTPFDEEREYIFNFFETIRDYEHLIIDLRMGPGGNYFWGFIEPIFRPNISSTVRLNSFVFLRIGDYNREFTENIRGRQIDPISIFTSHDSSLRPVDEIMERYDFSEINMSDMERMEYGFRATARIEPLRHSRFDNEPAFGGKIWLLTSPLMGSASEMSARIAKNTGFATLVGERTSGNFGGPRIFVALPNTGILFQMDLFYVTDEHGRPFDAGTYPHHFNRPGLDALETVLQLIEEGAY